MKKLLCAAATLAIFTTSVSALGQQSLVNSGSYWTAAQIDVEDGQFKNYRDYLNRVWMPTQEFAKSQGWIDDYHILGNVNDQDGEPVIILITRFAEYPLAA